MSRRTGTLTATVLAVAVTLAAVVGAVFATRNGVALVNTAAGSAVIAAFLTVGLVLTLVRPGHRVARLLLATAVGWSVGAALIEAGVYGLVTDPGRIPGAALLAVVGDAIRAAAWVLAVVAVAIVFPDGHLAGARWRWLGRLVVAALCVLVTAELIQPNIEETRLAAFANPIGLPRSFDDATSLLALTGTAMTAIAAIGAAASLVSRWRGGDPIRRQQLLAFAIAVCLPAPVPLGVIWGGPPPWLFDIAVIPLPIAIASAILQHRLYDLHLLANRTLLWATLSGAIVAVYALVIGGVGGLLGSTGARWLPWLAAGVVAVSFAPLRSALQSAVNRITYGRWEQPYDVLAELGAQLEAAADAGRLLEAVADELAGGLDLGGVRIVDASGDTLVSRGTLDADAIEVSLVAYGSPVGTLAYRAATRPPRPGDERLIEDLARQLGGVLHARGLIVALSLTREGLVLAREEERRRLRRDLHDGVGPALAALILKVDTIANLLPADAEPDRRRLRELRDDVHAAIVDVRRVVAGLRPPALDELGLEDALRQATARIAADAGLSLTVTAVTPLGSLPAAVEVSAYRIAVEAVTNVVRHAAASTCTVELSPTAGVLAVTVTDDGVGLAGPSQHGSETGNGLATMRERARELGGSLLVEAADRGTRVIARLPVAPVAA